MRERPFVLFRMRYKRFWHRGHVMFDVTPRLSPSITSRVTSPVTSTIFNERLLTRSWCSRIVRGSSRQACVGIFFWFSPGLSFVLQRGLFLGDRPSDASFFRTEPNRTSPSSLLHHKSNAYHQTKAINYIQSLQVQKEAKANTKIKRFTLFVNLDNSLAYKRSKSSSKTASIRTDGRSQDPS